MKEFGMFATEGEPTYSQEPERAVIKQRSPSESVGMENSVDVPASSNEGVSESESSEEEDGLRLDLIRCKSSTRCHTISAEEEGPQLVPSSAWNFWHITTRLEHEKLGKDIQGIDWSGIRHSKEEARVARTNAYENYLNVPEIYFNCWSETVAEEAAEVSKDGKFFPFHYFRSDPSLTILHFQLRNLLWATSSSDFYFLSNNSIFVYNSMTRKVVEFLDLSSSRPEKIPNIDSLMVSTICVSHGLVAAGGFHGELLVADVTGEIIFSKLMTTTDSGITNGIEIFESPRGVQLVAANNDNTVRLFSTERFDECSTFRVPWPANWASPSPDGKLLTVVGDNLHALLLDSTSGQRVQELSGHLDYSFAAAWHPNGLYFATGNQDTSVRIWDLRRLSGAVCMLPGSMSAVRSLRYSPCGRFLAAAEAADFVRLYDVASAYTRAQEIDFFSEISGIAFTPDSSSFMVGLQDDRWGGLMEFQRGCCEREGLQASVPL